MQFGYPILLDLAGRTVVVIGGGPVAARKAQGALAGGATAVRCVAPVFCPQMPAQVERIAEEFSPRHLEGAGIVFAATDSPAVNEQVVREARRRGLLVNRADVDEQEPGDFTVPAVWRSPAVTVAVSAGGSPAVAARIRDELAEHMDPGIVRMAEAMQVLRPEVRASSLPIEERRSLFRDLAGDEAMGILTASGIEGLRRWLVARYPALGSESSK